MYSISQTPGLFLMHFPLGRVVYASGPLLTGGPVPRTWRPDPLQVLWHISASYAFFSLGPVVAADPCHLPSDTDKLPSSANTTTRWSITQQSCESVSIPVRAGWISTALERANEESDQNILTSYTSPWLNYFRLRFTRRQWRFEDGLDRFPIKRLKSDINLSKDQQWNWKTALPATTENNVPSLYCNTDYTNLFLTTLSDLEKLPFSEP